MSKTTTLFVQHNFGKFHVTEQLSLCHGQSKSMIWVEYVEFSIWVSSDTSGCNAGYVRLYDVNFFKIRLHLTNSSSCNEAQIHFLNDDFADVNFVVCRALWRQTKRQSSRHDACYCLISNRRRFGTSPPIMAWETRDPHQQKEQTVISDTSKFCGYRAYIKRKTSI